MPETPPKEPSRFTINLNPDQLRKLLHSKDKEGQRLFAEVSRHAQDYQSALGLTDQDIESMQHAQGRLGMYPSAGDWADTALLKLDIDGQRFGVVAKHTACHDYGDFDAQGAWQDLLMAVSADDSLNRDTGSGTTWITAVPEEWHGKILEAIRTSAQSDDLSAELFRRPK